MTINKFDDIIPPSRRRETEPLSQPAVSNMTVPRTLRERIQNLPYITVGIMVCIIAISVAVLFYFSSARVEIYANTLSVSLQHSFTAGSAEGEIPYKIITAQKVASQSVKSDGTKNVTSYASGMITIYNTQAKEQGLIANTRFASGAGLIYRIRSGVKVPAGTVDKPGTISAKVYADKPGSTYNVGPSSFTIPGFAKSALATQVYARSSAAMTGGASGSSPVIDVASERVVRRALINALDPDMLKSISDQVPEDYLLLSGAATTTYQELPSEPSATAGMVDVKEQGTVTAIVFPNAALAKALAASVSGSSYQGQPVTITSAKGLQLSAGQALADPSAKTITFSLSGTVPLVYTVDSSRIAAAIAGKTEGAATVALSSYPEIGKAVIILRPFWRSTFPDDPAGIKVIVNNP